jgi:TRAP-type C4-dicarboxylate transport system permease small subunit
MKVFNRLEEILLVPILAIMATLTFVGVVARYAGIPIAYLEEVVPDLFVWATFLGASLAAKHRAHPNLSILAEKVSPNLRRWLALLVNALTVILFAVIGWQGIEAVRQSIQMGETTALGAPAYWVTLAIPVGAALFIVRVLRPAQDDKGEGEDASGPFKSAVNPSNS